MQQTLVVIGWTTPLDHPQREFTSVALPGSGPGSSIVCPSSIKPPEEPVPVLVRVLGPVGSTVWRETTSLGSEIWNLGLGPEETPGLLPQPQPQPLPQL